MSNKKAWELVLKKESGDIIIDYFYTKKEAEEEVKYRNILCQHLGYTPDLPHIVRKSFSKNKRRR
jgi:hypothetical protein